MADEQAKADALKKKRTFRKFSFRGLDLDALLDLSTEGVMDIVHARARRRFNRGLLLKRSAKQLKKKLMKAKKECGSYDKPDVVKTHLRDMIIIPEMIGSVIGVHNGKVFTSVHRFPLEPSRSFLAQLGAHTVVGAAPQHPEAAVPPVAAAARHSPRCSAPRTPLSAHTPPTPPPPPLHSTLATPGALAAHTLLRTPSRRAERTRDAAATPSPPWLSARAAPAAHAHTSTSSTPVPPAHLAPLPATAHVPCAQSALSPAG